MVCASSISPLTIKTQHRSTTFMHGQPSKKSQWSWYLYECFTGQPSNLFILMQKSLISFLQLLIRLNQLFCQLSFYFGVCQLKLLLSTDLPWLLWKVSMLFSSHYRRLSNEKLKLQSILIRRTRSILLNISAIIQRCIKMPRKQCELYWHSTVSITESSIIQPSDVWLVTLFCKLFCLSRLAGL